MAAHQEARQPPSSAEQLAVAGDLLHEVEQRKRAVPGVLLWKSCIAMSSDTEIVSPTFASNCGAATHTSSFRQPQPHVRVSTRVHRLGDRAREAMARRSGRRRLRN